MGTKYKTVGGSGTGLGQNVSSWLMNGLNTGTFGGMTGPAQFMGANPVGQTGGISGLLNSILAPGAGVLGGSLGQLLQTQQTNDVNALRARFGAGGGTSFGTPAAYAESQYRSQVAPQIATQVGQLQLQALNPILGLLGNFGARDIPQAETVGQENPWLTAAKFAIGAGTTAAGIFSGNPFAAANGLGQLGNAAGGAGGFQLNPAVTAPISGFTYPGGSFTGVPMNLPIGTMSLTGQNGYASGGNSLFNNPMLMGYSPTFNFGAR